MNKRTTKYARSAPREAKIQLDRFSFLLCYIVGLLMLILFGSPWSVLSSFIYGSTTFLQLMGLPTLISFATPFALIAFAVARARANGDRTLFRLPVLALVVSALPFLIGLLIQFSGGVKKSASSGVQFSILIPMAMVITIAPFILHIVCCVRGAKERKQDDEVVPVAEVKHARKTKAIAQDYVDTIRSGL